MLMPGLRAAVLVLLLALSGAVESAPSGKLWAFGDSSVDTGWYRKAPYSGSARFDAFISNPALGVGRPTSSPGAMSVEVLANLIGRAAKPANQLGTNYATGGAKNVAANTRASGGFPNAVPTARQIQAYLKKNTPQPEDVFVVSSGANDIGFALNHPPPNPLAYVEQQAAALARSIQKLSQAGAKLILVIGLPESFGNPPLKRALRKAHNDTLRHTLGCLHVEYRWADFNGLRKFIKQSSTNPNNPLGVTHITTNNPACSIPAKNPDPALTISADWAYVCSNASGAPSQAVAGADTYEFADDGHWATGAQRVLGQYLYCVAQPRGRLPLLEFPNRPRVNCSVFNAIPAIQLPVAAICPPVLSHP
jgi:phospholipase/lecithinase/hemolysin